MNVLTNGATRPVVRKKAALCLLRLIRTTPVEADVMPATEWAGRLAAMLEERDPGFLLGLTTLLLGIVSRNYEGDCLLYLSIFLLFTRATWAGDVFRLCVRSYTLFLLLLVCRIRNMRASTRTHLRASQGPGRSPRLHVLRSGISMAAGAYAAIASVLSSS